MKRSKRKTNDITKRIEHDIDNIISQNKYNKQSYNFLVEDFGAQVGSGAGNPEIDGGVTNEMPHKGKITLTMREFKYRNGLSSENLRSEIQKELKGKYACGGTAKEGYIFLQGDHRDTIKEALVKLGFSEEKIELH